eukprot:c40877_g1_i1 orf=77-373(+)
MRCLPLQKLIMLSTTGKKGRGRSPLQGKLSKTSCDVLKTLERIAFYDDVINLAQVNVFPNIDCNLSVFLCVSDEFKGSNLHTLLALRWIAPTFTTTMS